MPHEYVDPISATSPEISRRGFTVLGAGLLAAAAGNVARAADDFGKPHPPIVAEDDPAIRTMWPQLEPSAGTPIRAYAAMPHTIVATTPGIVLVQQIWGVDAQIRDVVRRFAKAGCITIAPLLYDRLASPDGDGASDIAPFSAIADKMNAAGLVPTDLQAAHDWILTRAPKAKIGIAGFCMGGGITLQTILTSKAFAAASMFYGSVRPGTKNSDPTTSSTFDFTDKITTPLIGSFGARDTSIKPADVEAMFARLHVPHDVKIYEEAGHAFFDDTRPRYVATAAEDAWQRNLAWFKRFLT